MEFHLKCNLVISRILESKINWIAIHLTNQRISQCPHLVSEGFWMVNDRNKMQTHRDGSKKTILCIHIENMSTALGIWSCLCSSISSSSLFSASCCHLFSALSARSTARKLLRRACMMCSPCGHDAFAVLAWRVLHVSAAARRGAAAYGNDPQ